MTAVRPSQRRGITLATLLAAGGLALAGCSAGTTATSDANATSPNSGASSTASSTDNSTASSTASSTDNIAPSTPVPQSSTVDATSEAPATSSAAALSPAAVIKQASETTRAAGSAMVSMTMTASIGSLGGVKITGGGPMDFATNTGDLTLSTSVAGQQTKIREIFVGDTAYIQLPGTDRWFKAPLAAMSGSNGDPTKALDMLKSLGNVQRIGTETVNGAAATHYRTTIDLSKALESSGLSQEQRQSLDSTLPDAKNSPAVVDLWLDDAQRVVRMVTALDLKAGSAGRVQTSSTVEYSDFGIDVKVTPPPAGKVTEAPEGLLGGLTGSTGGGSAA